MSIEEENSIVLDRPAKTRKRNNDESEAKIIAASYYGPLPLSSELKNYEMIVPGAGERILKMAENESAHRHNIELNVMTANIMLANKKANERWTGQIFAFIIAITCIGAGIWFIALGKSLAGTIFSGSGLFSVLAVFYSSRFLKLLRKKKDKQ